MRNITTTYGLPQLTLPLQARCRPSIIAKCFTLALGSAFVSVSATISLVRSISGYAWYYAGGLVSHMSKKQPMVALSSTEAEYIALTNVIQEGLWLHFLLAELNIPFTSPVFVYLDNSGAITLLTTAKFHQHTKHIDIQYHFIHFHINNGSFLLIWVSSHCNIADILTKALPYPAFETLCFSIGLVPQ